MRALRLLSRASICLGLVGAIASMSPSQGVAGVHGTKHRAQIDREFKLRNGEAAQVGSEDLLIRFERVTFDGRCPIGDPCAADVGDAVVLVTAQLPPRPMAALELHTHPNANSSGQYLHYRVRLIRLEPRPVGEQQVPLAQYWATFTVSNW